MEGGHYSFGMEGGHIGDITYKLSRIPLTAIHGNYPLSPNHADFIKILYLLFFCAISGRVNR